MKNSCKEHDLLIRQIIAIAYETVTEGKKLPLLEPMSEIAGRIAVQEGARYLEKFLGGNGTLLGGVPGVKPGKVIILGGGVVGTNSALIAAGFRAEVVLFDVNLDRLRFLDLTMPSNVKLLISNKENLTQNLKDCDLVIGGVLIPGARARHLITKDMLSWTFALNNSTLPYAIEIAEKGYEKAATDNKAIANGINMINGALTCEPVGKAFGIRSEIFSQLVA